MNCKRATTLISAYLDGELTSSEKLAMRAHLHECPTCALELQEERTLKAMLLQMQAPEPPADLEERLMAKVFETKKPTEVTVLRLLPAAAACFAIGFCGWFAYSASKGGTKAPAEPIANAQFDLSRDQAYAAGSDLSQPVPVLLTSSNGLR